MNVSTSGILIFKDIIEGCAVDSSHLISIVYVRHHFLEFLIGHVFTELLRNSLQVFKTDKTVFIDIKKFESMIELLLRVTLTK